MNKKLLEMIAKFLGYYYRIPKETMKQLLSYLDFIGFLELISIIETRFEDLMEAMLIGVPNAKQKTKNTKKNKKTPKTKQKKQQQKYENKFCAKHCLITHRYFNSRLEFLNSFVIMLILHHQTTEMKHYN